MIKASEDKTFPGAIVASLASPWGQAVSAGDPANTYFGSYREVFARDLYEAWTGLVADGDLATARDATLFLFERQQLPDGSMPRNSLVNGKPAPDSFGTQLDETRVPDPDGPPARAHRRLAVREPHQAGRELPDRARPRVRVERWEEQSGFSPSTIAAEIAGLVAAADLARANGDTASAAALARRRRRLAALGQGLDGDDERAARGAPVLHPPLEDGRPERGDLLQRRQRRPDARPARGDRRRLPRARAARRAARERPRRPRSRCRSSTRRSGRRRRAGPGWHRYNGDGYGDRASDGRPWAPSGQGTGHLWPVLSAERAEQALASGDAAGAASLLHGMSAFASGVGLIPEQDWELPDLAASPFGTDPTLASIGFANGGAAGSASPLTWSAASFVRLAADLAAGRNVVLPAVTSSRYVAHTQGTTTLTVTSPADKLVRLRLAGDGHGHDRPGQHRSTSRPRTPTRTRRRRSPRRPPAPDGSFSVDVAVTGGTSVLNVVAVSPSGGTAHAKRTVVFDFVPGTLLLDVTDPNGDDNGPGNYAYPTVRQLQAGRLRHPGVPGLRRRLRRHLPAEDARPDADVRQPARRAARRRLRARARRRHDLDRGRRTRTRNFTIAPPFAWSRLIQVQGFGQRYVDASGRDARHGRDQRERDLALHHLPRPEGVARHAGPGLGLHRRPHRPGRLQRRTRRGASSRRRRTSSSASAPRRAPTRTARSTRASCRRRST